ncbi:MAG: class I SAM-dependent methyltransferase [Deltaproteobacteria bacterium]|nr:class I SAM-dependent methyltransferase [Deltaproteobacteria bacterium]
MNRISYAIYKKVRMLTAPVSQIIELVPYNSDILDLGCGKGVFTEEIRNNRSPSTYTGVDLNSENIEYLKKKFPDFSFFKADAIEYIKRCTDNNQKYNCIIISDMLYLLSDELKKELTESAYHILRENGIMIIKEAGHNLLLFFQEYISVRLLRLTHGERINLKPAVFYEEILKKLSANYLIINAHRLLYPHFVIIVRK